MNIAADSFRATYIFPGRPVVIDGLVSPNDDLRGLIESLGDESRPVRIYGKDRAKIPRDQWDGYCDFVAMVPEQYAQWLRDGRARENHAYMAQVELSGTRLEVELEEHTGDFFRALFPSTVSALNLWLGPGGHCEPLHYDPADGVLFQLAGTKRVRLVAPRFSSSLYPFHFWSRIRPWFSRVSLSNPDHDSFPRLKEALASMIEIQLEPGQGLFIPAGWWHEVESVGDSFTCSVNRFFAVRPRRRLTSFRWGVPLYAAMVNKRFVLALETLLRRRNEA